MHSDGVPILKGQSPCNLRQYSKGVRLLPISFVSIARSLQFMHKKEQGYRNMRIAMAFQLTAKGNAKASIYIHTAGVSR